MGWDISAFLPGAGTATAAPPAPTGGGMSPAETAYASIALGPGTGLIGSQTQTNPGGGLGGFLGNLIHDVTAIPTGLFDLALGGIGDIIHHPVGVAEETFTLGAAHTPVQVLKPETLYDIPIGFVKNAKNYYFSKDLPSHLFQHPLQPILDASMIFGGAGALGRAATATGTAAAEIGAEAAASEAAGTAAESGAEAAGGVADLASSPVATEAAAAPAVLPPAEGFAGTVGRFIARQSPPIENWMQANAQAVADLRAANLARGAPGALQSGEEVRLGAAADQGVVGTPTTSDFAPTPVPVFKSTFSSLGDLVSQWRSADPLTRKAMLLDVTNPEPLAVADPVSGATFHSQPGLNPFNRMVWSEPVRTQLLSETVPEWMDRELLPLRREALAAEESGVPMDPARANQLDAAENTFARMQREGANLVAKNDTYANALSIKNKLDMGMRSIVSSYHSHGYAETQDMRRDLMPIYKLLLDGRSELPPEVTENLTRLLEGLDQGQGLHYSADELSSRLAPKGWESPEAAARDLVFQTGDYQKLTLDEQNSLLHMVTNEQIPIQGLWRYTPDADLIDVGERTAFEEKFRTTAEASGLTPEHQDTMMALYDATAKAVARETGRALGDIYGDWDIRFEPEWTAGSGTELQQRTLEGILQQRFQARGRAQKMRGQTTRIPNDDQMEILRAPDEASAREILQRYKDAGESEMGKAEWSKSAQKKRLYTALRDRGTPKGERVLTQAAAAKFAGDTGAQADAIIGPLEDESFQRFGDASDAHVAQLAVEHGVISPQQASELFQARGYHGATPVEGLEARQAIGRVTDGNVDQIVQRVQRGLNDHITATEAPYTMDEASKIVADRTQEIMQDELTRIKRAAREASRPTRRAMGSAASQLEAAIGGDEEAWQALSKTKYGQHVTSRVTTELNSGELAQRIGSEIRGATMFGPEFKTLTRIFRTGDFSTYIHEFGHVLRRMLPEDVSNELREVYLAKVHPGMTVDQVRAENPDELYQTTRNLTSPKTERWATYDTTSGTEIQEGQFVLVKGAQGTKPSGEGVTPEGQVGRIVGIREYGKKGVVAEVDVRGVGVKRIPIEQVVPAEGIATPEELGLAGARGYDWKELDWRREHTATGGEITASSGSPSLAATHWDSWTDPNGVTHTASEVMAPGTKSEQIDARIKELTGKTDEELLSFTNVPEYEWRDGKLTLRQKVYAELGKRFPYGGNRPVVSDRVPVSELFDNAGVKGDAAAKVAVEKMDGFTKLEAAVAAPQDKVLAKQEVSQPKMDALEEHYVASQRHSGDPETMVMADNEIGAQLQAAGVYVTGDPENLADTWDQVPTDVKLGTKVAFGGNNLDGDVGTVVELDPHDMKFGNDIFQSKYEPLASTNPADYEKMPIVYRAGGQDIVAEGNHRVYRAREFGEHRLKVTLVTPDEQVGDLLPLPTPEPYQRFNEAGTEVYAKGDRVVDHNGAAATVTGVDKGPAGEQFLRVKYDEPQPDLQGKPGAMRKSGATSNKDVKPFEPTAAGFDPAFVERAQLTDEERSLLNDPEVMTQMDQVVADRARYNLKPLEPNGLGYELRKAKWELDAEKDRVAAVEESMAAGPLETPELTPMQEKTARIKQMKSQGVKNPAELLRAAERQGLGGEYATTIGDKAISEFQVDSGIAKPTTEKQANALRKAFDALPAKERTARLDSAAQAIADTTGRAAEAPVEIPARPHVALGAAGPKAQADTLAKFDAGDLVNAKREADGWHSTGGPGAAEGELLDANQWQMNDVNTGDPDNRQFERVSQDAAAPVAAPEERAAEVPPAAPPPANPPAPPSGPGMGAGWTRSMEEAFANDLERWFYKGINPDNARLLPAFRIIGQQLTDMWRKLRGFVTDTEQVPEQAARVFDSYVGDVWSQMKTYGDQPVPADLVRGRRRIRDLPQVPDAKQVYGDGNAVSQLPGPDGTITYEDLRGRAVEAGPSADRKLQGLFGRAHSTVLKPEQALAARLNEQVRVLDPLRSRVIIPTWKDGDEALRQLGTQFNIVGVDDTRSIAGTGGDTSLRAYVVDPEHPDLVQEVEFATPMKDRHREATYAHDVALNEVTRQATIAEDHLTRLSMAKEPDMAEIEKAQRISDDLNLQRDDGVRYMEGYNEMLRDEVARDFGEQTPRALYRQAADELRLFVAKWSERDMFLNGVGQGGANFQQMFERAYLPLRIKSAPDENVEAILEGTSREAKSATVLDDERAVQGLPQPVYYPHMRPTSDKFSTFQPIGMGMRKKAMNKNFRATTGSLFSQGNYITDPFTVYSRRASNAIKMRDGLRFVQDTTQFAGRKITSEDKLLPGEKLFAPDFTSTLFKLQIGVEDSVARLLTKIDPSELMGGIEQLNAKQGRILAPDILADGILGNIPVTEKEAGALYLAVSEAMPLAQRDIIGFTRRGIDLYAVPEIVAKNIDEGLKAMKINDFTVAYDSMTHLWRSMALYFPGGRWILNNFAGNIAQGALEGVKMREVWQAATDRGTRWYLKELADMTGRPDEITRSGIFGSSDLYPNELMGRGSDTLVGQGFQNLISRIQRTPIAAPVNKWKEFIQGKNTGMENLFRSSAFREGVVRDIASKTDVPAMRQSLRSFWSSTDDMKYMLTHGITEANYKSGMDTMVKAFGDYSILSPLERSIVRRYFVPFYGFYKHVGMMLLRAPFDHPFKTQLVAELARQEQEIRDQYGPLPDWTSEMVPWGPVASDGTVPFLSTSGPNPFNVFADLGLSVLAPQIQAGLEMFTGRDSFTGQAFTSPDVVTPFGSDQSFRIIRGPGGAPVDVVPIDKVTPSLTTEVLNQFPLYSTAKKLVAGGTPYDTEGIIGSIGNPQTNAAGQVRSPTSPADVLAQQAGYNVHPYNIASYQQNLDQDRQAALKMAYDQWLQQQGAA